MELGENILENLSLEDLEDEIMEEVDDVEEGEVLNHQSNAPNHNHVETKSTHQNPQIGSNNNSMNKKKRRKKKNKKNNQQNSGPRPFVFDLDRFVLGVCKQLREKKSYLVYSAVGVLGASALGDLVKEVAAIQACGGQKTADGNRYRNGGGILWNILKTRDPNAYKEIMKKGRDFEKQFRRPWAVPPVQKKTASQGAADAISHKPSASTSDGDLEITTAEGQSVQQNSGENRRSVHDRIRVPVSYDDLPGEVSPNEPSSCGAFAG